MKTLTSTGLHIPFSPWTCNHGWDDEKEGKPCPACQGVCLWCDGTIIPLDPETGNCIACQAIFDSEYHYFKKFNETNKYPELLEAM